MAFEAEIDNTALMSSITEPAVPIGNTWAVTASMYTSSKVAPGRALLVGDAASFADPMSSYGVKKALASGWLAAIVVNTSIRTPELAATAADFFSRRERAMYRSLRDGLAVQVAGTGVEGAAAGAQGAETDPRPAGAEAANVAASAGDRFWEKRARWLADQSGDAGDANTPDRPDAQALRDDPEVRAAFHALRLGSGRLRIGSRNTTLRALVIGNRIRMAPALVTPRFPGGVRSFRDVEPAPRRASGPGVRESRCTLRVLPGMGRARGSAAGRPGQLHRRARTNGRRWGAGAGGGGGA